jgi:hypothetical protein
MPSIDFSELRASIAMSSVLDLLGFVPTERSGDQLRGPCPLHGSMSPDSRSFSVNPRKNSFRCFKCGAAGNQLELWATAQKLPIYEAALDLCQRLGLAVPERLHQRASPRSEKGIRKDCDAWAFDSCEAVVHSTAGTSAGCTMRSTQEPPLTEPAFMPFSRFFNRLFSSEQSWLLKLIGAGIVGAAISARVMWINLPHTPLVSKIVAIVATAALAMAGAGLLIRADAVNKRIHAGDHVGMVSRALFASGIGSILFWIVAALLVGFPLAIWIGSLTSAMPRGNR